LPVKFDYEKSEIHKVYGKSRALSLETIKLWLNHVGCNVDKKNIQTVLDLGCGTGRFVEPLRNFFNAFVYGVDPSEKMLSEAKANTKSENVSYLKGSAEQIPLPDNTIDLIFLSMTYHHLRDVKKAVLEMKRVLKPGGYVVIRNATKEDIKQLELFNFFPKAKQIELERMPDMQSMSALFQENNFKQIVVKTIKQKFAENYKQYFGKVSMRSLSSLQLITDKAFNNGLLALKKYCFSKNENEPVYESFTLFVFQLKN